MHCAVALCGLGCAPTKLSLESCHIETGGLPHMLTSEHRRAILSGLLGVQGVLILMGAVLLGFTSPLSAQLDNVVGAEASVAAIVLGAAFVMAFPPPTRRW